MTSACRHGAAPQLQLIESRTLSDFPSASAVEYDKDRLYVFGDDAPYLLIMDTAYRRVDTVHYLADTAFRVNRNTKPDIESSTLVNFNDESYLYAMGSFANASRRRLFYFPLSHVHDYLSIDYSAFAEKLTALPELNIEGMAFVKSKMVMANRANTTHRMNKLIIGGLSLFDYKKLPPPGIVDLRIDSSKAIGVSGLYYLEEKDLLFFTASEEDTPSAVQDGTINDSYLGWIEKFSEKMEEPSVKPARLIKLSSVSPVFIKQKVEGVCVQGVYGRQVILHLVSDNDNGKSGLFKVKLLL